ncbi:MAG: spore coat protein CotJB [Clostridia bacterium]|nr:spore coat protein CotJB [Clostridia bacterium]
MSRKELLKKLSAASFAVVDLQLFLDTHPKDATALATMQKYIKEAAMLRKEFESRFGPLKPQDIYGDTSFEWVNSPWPWDVCFVEGDA